MKPEIRRNLEKRRSAELALKAAYAVFAAARAEEASAAESAYLAIKGGADDAARAEDDLIYELYHSVAQVAWTTLQEASEKAHYDTVSDAIEYICADYAADAAYVADAVRTAQAARDAEVARVVLAARTARAAQAK